MTEPGRDERVPRRQDAARARAKARALATLRVTLAQAIYLTEADNFAARCACSRVRGAARWR